MKVPFYWYLFTVYIIQNSPKIHSNGLCVISKKTRTNISKLTKVASPFANGFLLRPRGDYICWEILDNFY